MSIPSSVKVNGVIYEIMETDMENPWMVEYEQARIKIPTDAEDQVKGELLFDSIMQCILRNTCLELDREMEERICKAASSGVYQMAKENRELLYKDGVLQIPEAVRINGINYKVSEEDIFMDGEYVFSRMDSRKARILVNKNAVQQRRIIWFLAATLVAMFDYAGIDLGFEEDMRVRQMLAFGLYQVLKENPNLI